jgi:hypothetical protein
LHLHGEVTLGGGVGALARARLHRKVHRARHLVVGPDRCFSPRYRLSFDSRDEGLQRVGSRGKPRT